MTQTATKPSMADFNTRYEAEAKASKKFAADNKLELKKVKIFLPGSQETICFTADIYANGKKVGYAENDGHGGCTMARTDKGNDLDNSPLLERWIDDVTNEEVNKKELAKTISKIKSSTKRKGFKAFAYKDDKGSINYVQFPHTDLAKIMTYLQQKDYQGYTIVNI